MKRKKKERPNCPDCSSKDGITGIFTSKGKAEVLVFLYCDKCGYAYKKGEN